MYRIDEEGLCIILMYVDVNLIVGSRKAIDKATKEVKEIFCVMVSPIATEYLGCEIDVAENYSCGWIRQYGKSTTSNRDAKYTGFSCSA